MISSLDVQVLHRNLWLKDGHSHYILVTCDYSLYAIEMSIIFLKLGNVLIQYVFSRQSGRRGRALIHV